MERIRKIPRGRKVAGLLLATNPPRAKDGGLRRLAREILRAGLELVVVTGTNADRVTQALGGLSARFVHDPANGSGLHAAIRAGVGALSPDVEAVVVCPAEQPRFDRHLIERLLAAPGDLRYPVHSGERGYPVMISARFIPDILAQPNGAHGCAYLAKRYPGAVCEIPASSADVLIDEAYEAVS